MTKEELREPPNEEVAQMERRAEILRQTIASGMGHTKKAISPRRLRVLGDRLNRLETLIAADPTQQMFWHSWSTRATDTCEDLPQS